MNILVQFLQMKMEGNNLHMLSNLVITREEIIKKGFLEIWWSIKLQE
jgi:hypothetical protein